MSDKDRNTGYRNTGDWNAGAWNAGDRNTGDFNAGCCNTGDRNTGYRNTGDWNAGDWSTGDWNTGDCNTGDFNTGNRNTGYFCTDTPSPVFFDLPWAGTWEDAYALVPRIELPCGAEWVSSNAMTPEEKTENPNHAHIGGFLQKRETPLREVFPSAWEKMDNDTRQRFLSLPNFDAEKFLAITGVDVRKPS